jgi:hypothetical protein
MMCIVLCFSCNNCNNDVSLIMFFYTYSIGLVAEFTYVNERPPLFYFMTFISPYPLTDSLIVHY